MNSNKTRVASVSSGKGGVGKTFVTISLAASFARKGESVLAVDCDLGLANMDIMLGINPKNTLKDIVFGALPVKDAIIHTKAGFDLIPGSSGIKELAHPMYEKIQDIKAVLEPVFCDYDHVLLDTGAGISEMVLQFNLMADLNIVVINRELTSLTDAYALIKVMYQVFGRDFFGVVVNSASDARDAQRIFNHLSATCKKFLGFTLTYLGYITRDEAVPRSIISREVLVLREPESAVALNCTSIVDALSMCQIR